MNKNIETYGELLDGGSSGDGKCAYLESKDGEIRMELDTDDADGPRVRAFKKALIELWNSQKD